jgi:hypothetical protein
MTITIQRLPRLLRVRLFKQLLFFLKKKKEKRKRKKKKRKRLFKQPFSTLKVFQGNLSSHASLSLLPKLVSLIDM